MKRVDTVGQLYYSGIDILQFINTIYHCWSKPLYLRNSDKRGIYSVATSALFSLSGWESLFCNMLVYRQMSRLQKKKYDFHSAISAGSNYILLIIIRINL